MHDLIFYGFNLPCHIVASFMEALSAALGFDGHVVGRRSGCNKTFMHRLLINVAGDAPVTDLVLCGRGTYLLACPH